MLKDSDRVFTNLYGFQVLFGRRAGAWGLGSNQGPYGKGP